MVRKSLIILFSLIVLVHNFKTYTKEPNSGDMPVRESNTDTGSDVPGRAFFISLLLKF